MIDIFKGYHFNKDFLPFHSKRYDPIAHSNDEEVYSATYSIEVDL
jgi:hypothetical protein